MIFSGVKGIVIDDKTVARITSGGKVIWSKTAEEESDFAKTYQAVEWIGNNVSVGHKAYLNLGFAFDTAARIEIGQYVTSDLSTAYAFGAAENSGKLRCMLTSPDSGKANCITYGSTGSSYISLTNVAMSANAVNDLVLTLEPGKLQSRNTTTGSENTVITQAVYTMSNNLYLFSQNYNGTARFSGITRITYFRYYDKTGVLICDLIPCYRKSDNVIGMYDKARDIFLTDAGDSVFEKGNNITIDL